MKGVTLIEIMVGLVIIMVAGVAAFGFFSYGLGSINKEGHRRAAMEQARARMEQLMATDVTNIRPPDGAIRRITGGPAPWTLWATPWTSASLQQVPINALGDRQMETTVQWIDDPAAATAGLDVLELSVKVWFTTLTAADNDANRSILRTLRGAKT